MAEDSWPVCRERGEDVRKFLHVTARGFAWAAEHDGQAAELLVKHAGPGGPPRTDLDMVRESQAEMGRVRPGHLCEQCAATRYSHKSESAAGLCRLLESWPCLPLVKAATAGLLLRPPLADVPTPGWQHYLDGQARWGAMEEGRWSRRRHADRGSGACASRAGAPAHAWTGPSSWRGSTRLGSSTTRCFSSCPVIREG